MGVAFGGILGPHLCANAVVGEDASIVALGGPQAAFEFGLRDGVTATRRPFMKIAKSNCLSAHESESNGASPIDSYSLGIAIVILIANLQEAASVPAIKAYAEEFSGLTDVAQHRLSQTAVYHQISMVLCSKSDALHMPIVILNVILPDDWALCIAKCLITRIGMLDHPISLPNTKGGDFAAIIDWCAM
jgi:hypothetical protein